MYGCTMLAIILSLIITTSPTYFKPVPCIGGRAIASTLHNKSHNPMMSHPSENSFDNPLNNTIDNSFSNILTNNGDNKMDNNVVSNKDSNTVGNTVTNEIYPQITITGLATQS
ncbi:hypothetical protein PIROE2DRAFT_12494 [Piromyces sp. E2]|nr:hypothetical protein PIROE2DRAFT_12494 [Piromyces sp. E2]|eukprot:OUM61496.1 hypothetical protein PIROE2DRAFT_12494 [Piromyces sp. E2]